jgi:glutamine synthetase
MAVEGMNADLRARRAERARDLQKSLAAEGVECVLLTVTDNAGVTLFKTFPVGRLESVVARGLGLSPVFDAFLIDDSLVGTSPVGGPAGDLRLLPDPFALRKLAAQPGWAWMPADKYVPSGDGFGSCQRTFARRMADRAKAVDLDVSMAFELECFVAREENDDPTPAFGGPAYSTIRFTEMADLIRDLTVALETQGVPVDQIHAEYAPGQLEVVVGPRDPVAAADITVVVRQTIRAVVRKHGLAVSFAPVVVKDSVGNGGHLHTSVWRDGHNLFSAGDDGQMDATAEAFTAGILAELPALIAVGCPSAASYLRLVPGHWAGAFACWGLENREAAIRYVRGYADGLSGPESANVEVKSFDSSANPYLLVGSVLAAGLAGVESALTLPAEIADDPGAHSEEDLHTLGIARLPQSLGEAMDNLEKSDVLRTAIGPALYDAFAIIRRGEAELFEGQDADDVIAAHRWRY